MLDNNRPKIGPWDPKLNPENLSPVTKRFVYFTFLNYDLRNSSLLWSCRKTASFLFSQ